MIKQLGHMLRIPEGFRRQRNSVPPSTHKFGYRAPFSRNVTRRIQLQGRETTRGQVKGAVGPLLPFAFRFTRMT
jgi:hypothetical protein